MKALSVEGPWPKEELEARRDKDNPRPHGHTDIISPFNNRVVNQARMNPRGVEVIPRGDGADDKTAEERENRLRAIDYESHGSQARLTALQNAVDRGIGYWRVDTEFESMRSRNLKIVIKRVANVNCILDDPDCQEADRSDRTKLIIGQWIHNDKAKQRWKKLKDRQDFDAETIGAAQSWLRPNQMFFAEYWKVEETPEPLYFFNGSAEGVFESELPEGVTVEQAADQREGIKRKVVQYFTNGLQILERKEWPGSWIPFPTCVGREKYEGEELVIESMTRKLRQPQLDFDVVRAAESESIAMTPKSKWQISDVAIAGYEDMYKMAHRNPQAYLLHHAFDEEGRPTTAPLLVQHQPAVEAFEIAANSYIRDAQNSAGMTGVDQKQRQAESGVAQERIDAAADVASFHFIDSWLMAIEFEGRIENELLTIIEDSARTVGFRTKDGKYKSKKLEVLAMPDGSIQHPYGPGPSHTVTIASGPAYHSQQEKAQDHLREMVKQPEFAQNPLAPLIIEGMQLGPVGDKMIKISKATLPAPVQDAYRSEEEQSPIPPEVQQQLQQQQAQLQQQDAALHDVMNQLESKTAELESKERMNTENNETKIIVAEISAKQKMLGEQVQQFGLQMERLFDLIQQGRDLDHSATEGSLDRMHTSIESDKAGALAREQTAAQLNGQEQQPNG